MNSRILDKVPIIALRALPLIDETGSVTRAAMSLGVSQPAISRAITILEAKIGLSILCRLGGKLALTAEGRRLAELGQKEALLRQNAIEDITALRQKRSGSLRIGSIGASASTRIIPKLLHQYQKQFPNVHISVREIPESNIIEAIKAGIIDIAVTLASDDPTIDQIPLAMDYLVALLPEKNDQPSKLTPVELASRPFIMTKGGSEPLVRDWFATKGLVPQIRHEAQQITSLLALVCAGLGVTIISDFATPEYQPGIKKIALDPPVPREIVLARNAGVPASEAISALWQSVYI